MSFVRKKEDFVCEQCGASVSGNGYTNHCPNCLWGKHVDISPGDRSEECGGMMEPRAITEKNQEERITHRCVRCGIERENRLSEQDDRGVAVRIAKDAADRLFKE